MRNFALLAAASAAAIVAAAPASAATSLLTAAPSGGTTTTFTATGNNGFGNPGPVVINGITVTGSPQVTYGDASYFIGGNGVWTSFPWVATNNDSGSITFDLGQNYGFVGGFVNYYTPVTGLTPTITALSSSMAVLGAYDLATLAPISTLGADDGGAFRGIQSTAGDIRYFRLSGSYILAHSITVGNASAVPEPATWAMMLAGFGAVGFAMRRRTKVSTRVRFA